MKNLEKKQVQKETNIIEMTLILLIMTLGFYFTECFLSFFPPNPPIAHRIFLVFSAQAFLRILLLFMAQVFFLLCVKFCGYIFSIWQDRYHRLKELEGDCLCPEPLSGDSNSGTDIEN